MRKRKLAVITTKDCETLFTPNFLKYLVNKYCELVSPEQADYILFTVPTLFNIEEVIKLRDKYKNKKIILGGHWTSGNAMPALKIADYICLGEGFEFLEEINYKNPEDMEYIISEKKINGRISLKIKWEEIPIIQVSKRSFYYWHMQGCPYKCVFCSTSWNHVYNKNPYTEKAIKGFHKKYKGHNLNIIANVHEDLPLEYLKTFDLRIQEYIKKPFKVKGFLKVGLEAFSEKVRKFYNKPVTKEELKEFLNIIHQLKQNTKIFVITGLEDMETVSEFAEVLPRAFSAEFSLTIIPNYLSPSAGTPLQFIPLQQLRPIALWKVFHTLKKINANISLISPSLSIVREHVHTLLERTNYDNLEKVLKVRKKVFNGEIKKLDNFFDLCYSLGLEKEIESDTNIILFDHPNREQMKKVMRIKKHEIDTLSK